MSWYLHAFQLSQDHIMLVNNELRYGGDPGSITQDIAGILLFDQDEGDENMEQQFLMSIEMRYMSKTQNLEQTYSVLVAMLFS